MHVDASGSDGDEVKGGGGTDICPLNSFITSRNRLYTSG